MTKIVMQKMGKIVAVSVMSAIVSISLMGVGFLALARVKYKRNRAMAKVW